MMTWLDWGIVAGFLAVSVGLGSLMRRTAGRSLEAYFASNRSLGWWLAGTSITATAFSSDTPLLITGMVRRKGIWGVWEVWALGISTMLAVFVFAKLWKRLNVLTEVEFVERRYHGRPAAFLRGFKALYWGLAYNCFIIGAWPVTGMAKVLQETTGLTRESAILGCVILGTFYTTLSGLWGVVLTDAFQFVWAMIGAVVLAVYAVRAAGGLAALTERLQATDTLAVVPPMASDGSVLTSPFGWFLGLMLIQWWAWKNTDGGGVIVQRIVSCRDERQAVRSVLWFNVAHYCLRSWPWVVTAVASLALVPDHTLLSTVGGETFVDHERAYPRLLATLLPSGLRGVLLAAFFAAFLSTLSTQLNWGASYLVHDGYRRFLRPGASEAHYVRVARWCSVFLALGGMGVALVNQTIGASFTWILNLTAGIGPVLLARWVWWRVNAWSELAALTVSLPILLVRPAVFAWLGWPQALLPQLLFMVLGTALVWVPVTLLTAPVDRGVLKAFYAAVRPPGWWHPVAIPGLSRDPWGKSLLQWALATVALLATTVAPFLLWFGQPRAGWGWVGVAVGAWGAVAWFSRAPKASPSASR